MLALVVQFETEVRPSGSWPARPPPMKLRFQNPLDRRLPFTAWFAAAAPLLTGHGPGEPVSPIRCRVPNSEESQLCFVSSENDHLRKAADHRTTIIAADVSKRFWPHPDVV
jgi:hypothetical protein